MKHTNKEIIKALTVIKDICRENGMRCQRCPLCSSTYDMCVFDVVDPAEIVFDKSDDEVVAVK